MGGDANGRFGVFVEAVIVLKRGISGVKWTKGKGKRGTLKIDGCGAVGWRERGGKGERRRIEDIVAVREVYEEDMRRKGSRSLGSPRATNVILLEIVFRRKSWRIAVDSKEERKTISYCLTVLQAMNKERKNMEKKGLVVCKGLNDRCIWKSSEIFEALPHQTLDLAV